MKMSSIVSLRNKVLQIKVTLLGASWAQIMENILQRVVRWHVR